jgi:hypothetical protein
MALLGIGGAGVLILLYIAKQSTGSGLADVPKFESEEQFDGISADAGGRVNAGTPLDLNAGIHFFVPGYCCPGQQVAPTRQRYPLVSGGNMTAVMNHGMDRLSQGSPDNDWRVQPPSEVML